MEASENKERPGRKRETPNEPGLGGFSSLSLSRMEEAELSHGPCLDLN